MKFESAAPVKRKATLTDLLQPQAQQVQPVFGQGALDQQAAALPNASQADTSPFSAGYESADLSRQAMRLYDAGRLQEATDPAGAQQTYARAKALQDQAGAIGTRSDGRQYGLDTLLTDPGATAKYALGQMAPHAVGGAVGAGVGAVAGAGLGALLRAPSLGAKVGAWTGAALDSLSQNTGTMIANQQNDAEAAAAPLAERNLKAGLGGVGSTALDMVLPSRFLPGGTRAVGAAAREGIDLATGAVTAAPRRSVLRNVAAGAAEGTLKEGITEGAQNVVEQATTNWTAGRDQQLDWKQIADNAVMGALAGAPVGGVASARDSAVQGVQDARERAASTVGATAGTAVDAAKAAGTKTVDLANKGAAAAKSYVQKVRDGWAGSDTAAQVRQMAANNGWTPERQQAVVQAANNLGAKLKDDPLGAIGSMADAAASAAVKGTNAVVEGTKAAAKGVVDSDTLAMAKKYGKDFHAMTGLYLDPQLNPSVADKDRTLLNAIKFAMDADKGPNGNLTDIVRTAGREAGQATGQVLDTMKLWADKARTTDGFPQQVVELADKFAAGVAAAYGDVKADPIAKHVYARAQQAATEAMNQVDDLYTATVAAGQSVRQAMSQKKAAGVNAAMEQAVADMQAGQEPRMYQDDYLNAKESLRRIAERRAAKPDMRVTPYEQALSNWVSMAEYIMEQTGRTLPAKPGAMEQLRQALKDVQGAVLGAPWVRQAVDKIITDADANNPEPMTEGEVQELKDIAQGVPEEVRTNLDRATGKDDFGQPRDPAATPAEAAQELDARTVAVGEAVATMRDALSVFEQRQLARGQWTQEDAAEAERLRGLLTAPATNLTLAQIDEAAARVNSVLTVARDRGWKLSERAATAAAAISPQQGELRFDVGTGEGAYQFDDNGEIVDDPSADPYYNQDFDAPREYDKAVLRGVAALISPDAPVDRGARRDVEFVYDYIADRLLWTHDSVTKPASRQRLQMLERENGQLVKFAKAVFGDSWQAAIGAIREHEFPNAIPDFNPEAQGALAQQDDGMEVPKDQRATVFPTNVSSGKPQQLYVDEKGRVKRTPGYKARPAGDAGHPYEEREYLAEGSDAGYDATVRGDNTGVSVVPGYEGYAMSWGDAQAVLDADAGAARSRRQVTAQEPQAEGVRDTGTDMMTRRSAMRVREWLSRQGLSGAARETALDQYIANQARAAWYDAEDRAAAGGDYPGAATDRAILNMSPDEYARSEIKRSYQYQDVRDRVLNMWTPVVDDREDTGALPADTVLQKMRPTPKQAGYKGHFTVTYNEPVMGANKVKYNPVRVTAAGFEALNDTGTLEVGDGAQELDFRIARAFAEGMSMLLGDPRSAGITDAKDNSIRTNTNGDIEISKDTILYRRGNVVRTAGDVFKAVGASRWLNLTTSMDELTNRDIRNEARYTSSGEFADNVDTLAFDTEATPRYISDQLDQSVQRQGNTDIAANARNFPMDTSDTLSQLTGSAEMQPTARGEALPEPEARTSDEWGNPLQTRDLPPNTNPEVVAAMNAAVVEARRAGFSRFQLARELVNRFGANQMAQAQRGVDELARPGEIVGNKAPSTDERLFAFVAYLTAKEVDMPGLWRSVEQELVAKADANRGMAGAIYRQALQRLRTSAVRPPEPGPRQTATVPYPGQQTPASEYAQPGKQLAGGSSNDLRYAGAATSSTPDMTDPAVRKEVSQYIFARFGTGVDVMFQRSLPGGAFGAFGEAGSMVNGTMLTQATIALAMHAPQSVAFHEALHALAAELRKTRKGQEMLRILLEYASTDGVVAQLDKLYGGTKRWEAMSNDPEERLAYLFQAFAAGEITLPDSEPRTVLGRLVQGLKRLLRLVTNDQRARHILEYFHSGEYSPSKHLLPVDAMYQSVQDMENNWQRGARKAEEYLGRISDTLLTAKADRLRNAGIQALADIADRFAPRPGQPGMGYMEAADVLFAQFAGQYADAVAGLSEQQKAELYKVRNDKIASPDAEVMAANERVQELFDKVYEEARSHGLELKYRGEYMPRVWDSEAITKDHQGFVDMLVSKYKMDRTDAQSTWAKLANGADPMIDEDRRGAGYNPFFGALNERKMPDMKFDDIRPWLRDDMDGVMVSYLRQATKRSVYHKMFGDEGRWIASKLAEARAQGASAAQLADAEAGVRGLEGTYNVDISPKWRTVSDVAITGMNVLLLPLSLISNLSDAAGIGVRDESFKTTMKAMAYGLKRLPNWVWGKEALDSLDKQAEEFGTTVRRGIENSMGMYTGMLHTSTTRNINDLLFKYNGVDGFTRSMRAFATEQALQAIESYLASGTDKGTRMAEELGLTADDVQWVEGEMVRDSGNEKLVAAVNKWVNSAVLKPDAAYTPLWFSDPRLAILSHLKQYSFLFYNKLSKFAWHELEAGNRGPMLQMVAYLPIIAAGMYMRALAGNGGELPPHMEEWGLLDWILEAIYRSGIAGPAVDFGSDAGSPTYLAGPTVDWAVDNAAALMRGDTAGFVANNLPVPLGGMVR